ncbi:hypothetical protein [Rhodococcoides corynebacterioides]|uniref:hypothetical protein n=1 Tax=Rhodococcoides corynebacterioides TaxID=53972 RepID=UPI001C9AD5BF|nr:hypothetical protein [Rhodococcus corynebacterioides]MBY6350843.1 hypothetical protein [Rhodococcus corynebacterioides]
MATGEVVVPVWALSTEPEADPVLAGKDSLTAERLAELRTVLATMADTPVVTLEAHDVPLHLDRREGLRLDQASPLASQLALLIRNTPKVTADADGETLYRMVVPAKVARQFGAGLVKPMVAKSGHGVFTPLLGKSGIVAHSSFVPVTGSAAGKAGMGLGAAGAMTVAAPLVLAAVAAGLTMHAEKKRADALDNMTRLLDKLHNDALANERDALNGCVDAIEKATSILLDRGRVGASLGLDSAAHAISTATSKAEARLTRWRSKLAQIGGSPVELSVLKETFTGIDEPGGEFRAQLEIAALAIALKKRVLVLQAVEHAQSNEGNVFQNFTQALRTDQARVTNLESGITELLTALSEIRLDRSHGVRDIVFRAGEVDKLLAASYRIRAIASGVDTGIDLADVKIDIVQEQDGSVVVFPAQAA